MADTIFKNNEIIVLLGAGASVEAGIPDSQAMVQKIQDKISGTDKNWARYKDLYRYIRSSVFYADGLDGIIDDAVPFNIERLVNVLDELIKKERHTLYPFVGAWNPKLLEVAGEGFDHVRKFRGKILDILRKKWLALTREEEASYYSGLLDFQREYQYPLRVFSLNYDLCVEKTCRMQQASVQRGFDNRVWDWRLFDETTEDHSSLLLYKLHGSVDWFFAEDSKVTYSDTPSSIQDDEIALIFGTAYKLQYIDPFLFYVYELRRWSLDSARAIICIGYGFNDDHINGILAQSLRQDEGRRLWAVIGPQENETRRAREEQRIKKLFDPNQDHVKVLDCGAKEFLHKKFTIEFLSESFPPEADLFSQMPDE